MKPTPEEQRGLRVYVAPCGVGLGHVTRCDLVAKELSKAGCNLVFSSYLDGLVYLKRTEWRTLVSPPMSFGTREDGTIDTKLTATQNGVTVGIWKFLRQVISETRQILRYNPAIVMSDTRVSTILAGYLLRKP
ncbi:MAG TPA: hypothetical protein VE177_00795, partial [Candidatus Binatus sp.]|nr:hypothetical protein [Candidatus Binatus sp.]